MPTAFSLCCFHLESRIPDFKRLKVGLTHSSEGCQLKSINSCAGLIKNSVSTLQNNYELVYWRQLHSQSEKNQSIPKLVPNVFQAELSHALKGNHLPAPDLPSCRVLFTWTKHLEFGREETLLLVTGKNSICANKLQSLQDQIYHENGSKITKYHLYKFLNTEQQCK